MMMYDVIHKSNDEARKIQIKSAFELINTVMRGAAHEDTKFHCYGEPLKEGNYYEEE